MFGKSQHLFSIVYSPFEVPAVTFFAADKMMRGLAGLILEVSDFGCHGFCNEVIGKAEGVVAETVPT